MDGILERFHGHSSILKVQETSNLPDKFSFHEISEDDVQQEILRLDGIKSTQVEDFPLGMLRPIIDINASMLTKIINSSLKYGCFQDVLSWRR